MEPPGVCRLEQTPRPLGSGRFRWGQNHWSGSMCALFVVVLSTRMTTKGLAGTSSAPTSTEMVWCNPSTQRISSICGDALTE